MSWATALGSAVPGDLSAWVEVEPFRPQSPEMNCANRSSSGEWSVALDGARPVVRPYDRLAQEAGEKLPFAPPKPSKSPGDTKVLKTADGYLVGIDQGEWGGGLWAYSGEGSGADKLSDENIHSLLTLDGDVVAIGGLSHLGQDRGVILKIRKLGNRWRVERSLKLDGAPMTDARDAESGAFIVTTQGLSRYSGGVVRKLHASSYQLLYPNSIAVTSEGLVFVGMRHAVTRLRPGKEGYSESWMVPPECASLEVTGNPSTCKCIPRPTGAH